MATSFRRFDAYLPHLSISDLKPMVKLWGAKAPPRKEECVGIIVRGLASRRLVSEAIASLTPYERTALAIVKWMGGTIEAVALATALRASGVALPKSRGWTRSDAHELIEPLHKRGLLLYDSSRALAFYDSFHYGDGGTVFSDERLLEHIGPPEYAPLRIPPAAPPPGPLARRPAGVMLDILAILQAIETIGGLQLTKAGAPRAADIRKLLRALSWQEQSITVDGLALPDPVGAFTTALERAQLVERTDDSLVVRGPIDQLTRGSYAEQIGQVLRGFIRARAWPEYGNSWWGGSTGIYRVQGRLALVVALAALPNTDDFFAVDDLERALFERVGEHFSLFSSTAQPYFFNKAPDEIERELKAWRARLREDWLQRERPWIDAALTTWLYFLGVVELGLEGGRPICVRLTELGRTLLRVDAAALAAVEPAEGPAWRVQPNFDVVVYLDRARPEQIALVERHAERLQAQAHVATYHITRESIYQGLEAGSQIDGLLAQLREGAEGDLPQNVAASIREWAGQRERITLRRRASLLEFPDELSRRQQLASGIPGMPVGDRFILLTGTPRALPPHQLLDYADALPPCLSAHEDGALKLIDATPDLLVRPQLNQWAEVQPSGWRLTAASVAAAIKAGGTLTQLMALLKDRLVRPLPPLLGLALRAWAGKPAQLSLASVTLLRCPDPAVFAAIQGSPMLKPFLRAALAPDLLLVDTRSVAALRERLAWAGLAVSDTLDVTA